MPADTSCVTLPGPWRHEKIQANGAQFHAAVAGEHREDRPLVLLVHAFPQYWWAWRHQIGPIAEAGYKVVALDRRGIGGSDKTPDAEDGLTLASDLTAVVRAFGARKSVLVGAGRGGALAWSAVSMEQDLFAGLVTASSPHPRTLHRVGIHVTFRTWRHVIASMMGPLSRRGLVRENSVRALLTEWSAPGNDGATREAHRYTQALQLPGAAKVSLEQLRWTWRAQGSPSGRKYLRESANSVHIPVLAVRGDKDPLLPDRAWDGDLEFAVGPYRKLRVPNAGHFIAEEQPEAFTKILLDFLADIDI
ncbi:pimeloyl-ACP methyl ester carboxylesterase [Trueperella bonasi]|uniref:Pimeloyl-ACP methyl ester carboxylesterase n=1 Tax=Trueperella bonasi TaxID=312286 RepID=A0ABT9NGE2_9ACTO|nr:alpha/beta hydrolase [Trueperella bonasi]MDP9806247.1 pimeloyl-ACP methyl ester carboxylesterase [Trueperella bonasi]